MSERSGAARGLENDSLTGGMGGDYTSWTRAIKANRRIRLDLNLSFIHIETGWGNSPFLQDLFSGVKSAA
jgi:hypothetical protein